MAKKKQRMTGWEEEANHQKEAAGRGKRGSSLQKV